MPARLLSKTTQHELRKAVRARMTEIGLTNHEAARALGVSRSYVVAATMPNGAATGILLRLADHLGIDRPAS